jgi:N-formylglutamate amidohydrolase
MFKFIPVLLLAFTLPLQAQEKPNDKIELDKLLLVKKGTLPIILSAPHGGRTPIPGVPVREGKGVDKFVTGADTDTDHLAEKLAAAIRKELGGEPYMVVAQFQRRNVDANRPPEQAYESEKAKPVYDAYHKAVKDACDDVRKQWGRGFLIDIHGQAGEKDTIFRGTAGRKSLKDLETRFGMKAVNGPNSIFGALEKKGYKIFPPGTSDEAEDKRYSGGFITSHYGSSNGTAIDSIQMEFGTNLRKKEAIDKTAADTAAAIKLFAKEYLPLEKAPGR